MRPQPIPDALPFTRSYAVIPDRLLAGFYPGDRDPSVMRGKVEALLDCGVTHVLNLMEPQERDHAGRRFHAYDTAFLRLAEERGLRALCARFPIRDLGTPSREEMVRILDWIDAVLAADAGLYVHCWGSRGRTGTVVGCWLARYGETDPLKTLRRLTAHAHRHFGEVPETWQQRRFVQEWRTGR